VLRTWTFGLPLLLVGAVALTGCGGSKTVSRQDYTASVTRARDRVDYALAQITQAKTQQEFLDRMQTSADLIDNAANDLHKAGSAQGFDDESTKLVASMHQLAADLAGTSEQIQTPGFEDLFSSKGISFQSWIDINNTLASLTKQGIEVAPLARH
jgi:uncharacterized protein Yka (UPF0111/DUF47 family)